ncbi:MAG: hypothetical protein DDT22_01019 [candidate division WS2 bacterium]|nr:hypothetical protein [Bacillota bacterium]MBT9175344.1 hypothetical protein [Candidatus Lithacetigena glycinireducens]
MRKTFKYRLKANKDTIQKAEEILNLCRQIYNKCPHCYLTIDRDLNSAINILLLGTSSRGSGILPREAKQFIAGSSQHRRTQKSISLPPFPIKSRKCY